MKAEVWELEVAGSMRELVSGVGHKIDEIRLPYAIDKMTHVSISLSYGVWNVFMSTDTRYAGGRISAEIDFDDEMVEKFKEYLAQKEKIKEMCDKYVVPQFNEIFEANQKRRKEELKKAMESKKE